MRRWAPVLLAAVLAAAWFPNPVHGGAYARLVNCSSVVNGFCAQGIDRNGSAIGAFAIVHPPGYAGTQATIDVEVCTNILDTQLQGTTQRAVAKWAALAPQIGNCGVGCLIPEDPLPMGIFHAESVILHELGHALGLDHPNLLFNDPAVGGNFIHTSFSAAYDGAPAGVLIGSDGVRGSKDDFMDDLFGTTAVNINWFRELDNDPFVVDSEVIDIDHYSRSTNTQLPAGSTWAANANFCHGFQLGHPRTHAVMYSVVSTSMVFTGITADDANMIKMQRAGEDRLAGTADDYVAQITWVPDCADAEIEVRFGALPTGVPGATAVHVLPTFASPPPPLARHYTSAPQSVASLRIVVTLKDNANWDYGEYVFADGFESGNFSGCSSVSPIVGPRSPGASIEGGGHPYFCPIPPP